MPSDGRERPGLTKFMSIEDSHQGALVCKVDVEVLREPGRGQEGGNVPGAVDGGGGAGRHRHSRSPFRGPPAPSLRASRSAPSR